MKRCLCKRLQGLIIKPPSPCGRVENTKCFRGRVMGWIKKVPSPHFSIPSVSKSACPPARGGRLFFSLLCQQYSEQKDYKKAFTLAEMSMVLVVVGLVIMVVFPALTAFRQSMQVSATQSNLQALMRATTAFVQANGCLPCPTPAATTGAGFGRVRGEAGGLACQNNCTVYEGIVPFISMGLPQQIAKDGWGRWITMRVDPALTINFGVVPPTALCVAGDTTPSCVTGESRKGLCQDGALMSKVNRVSITTAGGGTQQAALLFLSHGANGFGAFKADPAVSAGTNAHPAFSGGLTPCSATGGFERCNANGDAAFIEAPFSNDPTTPYDDVLLYVGRDALVSSLGNPACQTSW